MCMKNKIHAAINTVVFVIMCAAGCIETDTWAEVIVLFACALYLTFWTLINMDCLQGREERS